MKKKGLIISIFGSCVVAFSSTMLLANQNAGMYAFASEDCEGNHYSLVEPTFDSAGHREYWVCCKHQEVYFTKPEVGTWTDHTDDQMIGGCDEHNAAYLPALNTTDYKVGGSLSGSNQAKTFNETWTHSVSGASDYVYETSYTYGYVAVKDYSGKSLVTKYYSYKTFNDAFDGITLSVDTKTSTMTFEVTKEGGYTFENVILEITSNTKNTVLFTGEPLTIIAPDGNKGDGLVVTGATGTGSMATMIVDNDLSVIYPSTYASCTKSGLKESIVTINEGASLTIEGYDYGIWAHYTPITVNGTLNISAKTQAIETSNSSNSRTIVVPDDHDISFNGAFVRTGGNSSTAEIKSASVKTLTIEPTTGPHHDTHTWSEDWTSDASQHWHECTFDGCDEVSDKASHEFDWVIDQPATYEAKGSKHEECTICGYAKDPVEIDQLVHSYSSDWSSDNSQHWHSCTDEGYEDKEYGSDIGDHEFAEATIVAPTYNTAGSKTRGTCSICGESIESYVIPTLNETDYTRTCTNTHGKTLTETWTLKNPSSIGESSYVVTKTFNSGFVTVNDKSSGAFVRTDYTPYSFNKTFDGIEMLFDETKKELVVNVTKEGGYVFDDACLNFPSQEGNTITITGEPLVINAPNGTEYDGLGFDGSTNLVSDMCHAVIDTDVSVIYSDSYAATSSSGLKANYFNVNEGASFTTSGFKYGVWTQKDFTINGLFDVSGTDLAMKSNNSNNRTISFGNNLALYFDDVFKKNGPDSTSTSDINTAKAKHVMIVPYEPEPEPEFDYKYTVMMYMSPSTLEYNGGVLGYASDDLKEICQASKDSDDVRFIVETGGVSNKWNLSSSYLDGATSISTSALQRWEVTGGKLKLIETLNTNQMCTQSSFESFLKWGLKDYSAERMGVILYGHGNAMLGCLPDANNSNNQLLQSEVAAATKNALEAYERDKFTWIGYDACIMAEADFAAINSQYYDYMICSQETEPAGGWAYSSWVPKIYNNPDISNSLVFSDIVSSYNAQYTSRASTLSCLDLTKCDALIDAFEDYASAIKALFPSTSSERKTFFNNNIAEAFGKSHMYNYQSYGEVSGLADFVDFLNKMESYFPDISNDDVLDAIDDMVIYNGYSDYFSSFIPCGLNIFVAANHIHDDAPSGTYYLQANGSEYYSSSLFDSWSEINYFYSPVRWDAV